MGSVTTIGLDLAKKVFQVQGVDAEGVAVIRQRITRGRMLKFFAKLPQCQVGIEACATSHYWARELVALGHDVKLMPVQYGKPYVKRGKNDAADAEAICEAVTRPTTRFVGIKSPEQQSAMMLHRVLAPGGRLVDERQHDRPARHRCLDDGDLAALEARRLLHHSDQGSQYTSEKFQRSMTDNGVTCLMSRSGNIWDNAATESFFSSLKTERIGRKTYRTRNHAKADVFDYIERFYNPTRRHSTLGYLSPMVFVR